ncbi:MAG: hypothetical protein GWP06_09140 [Actinobacteria bacterium]|nr:hypothetical protein [Actinomycetota bacterium]
MTKGFDYTVADSQGTLVEPLSPEEFDVQKYVDYEAALLEGNAVFWESQAGVAVYRRFRVPQVFSFGCRDMKQSLAWQLGALEKSMDYKADISNFLEPWYGIGTVAGAFGATYKWEERNAPAIAAPFTSVREVLGREIVPIEDTDIGKRTLEMIEYFLDKTGGKIPVSPTDTQAALNAASFLIETNSFYMEMFDHPDEMKKLLSIITDLTIDFTKKQIELIGDALVLPGHGFASSRKFTGLGMSSDVMVMISGEQYKEFEAPYLQKAGEAFGGAVFHSCGNWSNNISAIKSVPNLIMVDAAFSQETDPDSNPPEPFVAAFAGTGIIVNARIVGNAETVLEKVKRLWQPHMKLIVVTYCKTPREQADVYDEIRKIVE